MMSVTSSYIKNFPFPTVRENQPFILREIEDAFNSGYKFVILEAPTGSGKSACAVAVARTLGTSYICTSTKDLQTQYARDFPFIRVANGKNNFICAVKEDFIRNGTHKCVLCPTIPKRGLERCKHTNVDYGPCVNNPLFQYDPRKNYRGCKYRTLLRDYEIRNLGTVEEQVFIGRDALDNYQSEFSGWSYIDSSDLKDELKIWRPCEYYHQLNIALAASHSIFNYSQFLIYMILATFSRPPSRRLLVLDEAHRIEEEVVKLVGISLSRKKLRKYIPNFEIEDHGHDIIEWTRFIIELVKKICQNMEKLNDEYASEAETYVKRLVWIIDKIEANPDNWIVCKVEKDGDKIDRVEIKTLDVSSYCSSLFNLCEKTLMMSGTILDKDAFCSSIGLPPSEVKFIRVGSDFPKEHRPIYPLNIEYLNYKTLNEDRVRQRITTTIDKIMTFHKNQKGIIHTTSYAQLNFIRDNISLENKRRLLETNPEVERDEVIAEHISTAKPTVLISPSLQLGLDLKDDLSRFSVIAKIPYPNLGDRWTDGKRKNSAQWYNWQTALHLIQAIGRSVRSKEDWAVTYIVDSVFGSFINKNKSIMPGWFLESIKW